MVGIPNEDSVRREVARSCYVNEIGMGLHHAAFRKSHGFAKIRADTQTHSVRRPVRSKDRVVFRELDATEACDGETVDETTVHNRVNLFEIVEYTRTLPRAIGGSPRSVYRDLPRAAPRNA